MQEEKDLTNECEKVDREGDREIANVEEKEDERQT